MFYRYYLGALLYLQPPDDLTLAALFCLWLIGLLYLGEYTATTYMHKDWRMAKKREKTALFSIFHVGSSSSSFSSGACEILYSCIVARLEGIIVYVLGQYKSFCSK